MNNEASSSRMKTLDIYHARNHRKRRKLDEKSKKTLKGSWEPHRRLSGYHPSARHPGDSGMGSKSIGRASESSAAGCRKTTVLTKT